MMMENNDEDFSVFVLASDLGVDVRSFLAPESEEDDREQDSWHDCSQELDDFTDLEFFQFFHLAGSDKYGNRIVCIIGKCFPAQVVNGQRLKSYVIHKLSTDLPDGPFCIVYMHTRVQKEINSPGMSILRWIYEDLPNHWKDRLQFVYFLHPGFQSRLALATLGRFFLSRGLYWKVKYVSRLQYLWDDIKRGEIEIPDFVKNHDDILEYRPLTDYGIEPDSFHLNEIPNSAYSYGRGQERWASREFMD